MYKKINYGAYKKEIRALLRKRLLFKERIRYHENKIAHHNARINDIVFIELVELDKELDRYFSLTKKGNGKV